MDAPPSQRRSNQQWLKKGDNEGFRRGFCVYHRCPVWPSTTDLNLFLSFFYSPPNLLLSCRWIANPREVCSCRKIATSVVPSFVV